MIDIRRSGNDIKEEIRRTPWYRFIRRWELDEELKDCARVYVALMRLRKQRTGRKLKQGERTWQRKQ